MIKADQTMFTSWLAVGAFERPMRPTANSLANGTRAEHRSRFPEHELLQIFIGTYNPDTLDIGTNEDIAD